ncbi:Pectate lyase L [Mycena kentingensis (nom. inval.)]|nr:Pectate lyase L [Mycena kentingensis (nom. inval.)]
MLSFLKLLAIIATVRAADIYVSPTATRDGTGTMASPFASIQNAVNAITPGSTIFLRGGTFNLAKNVAFSRVGSASAGFTVRAFAGEKVILNGEALTGTPAPLNGALDNPDRGIFHIQNAQFWSFFDLEFINGPYGVYARDASNNHYERISTHDNYETGFQLEGASSNNTVFYLDSYMNRDPRKNGESADGFGCKEGSGTGNILKGARLWNNVDDGLDLWEFLSPVTIMDTISWGNGFNRWGFTPFEGDGNGFKLGGGGLGPANHVVTNCIAFGNAQDGFTDNKQAGTFTITRNTAYNNARNGFQSTTANSILRSNIAAVNGVAQQSLTGTFTSSGNSWDSSTAWTNASFKSVSTSLVMGARAANGKIVASNFLLPTSGAAIGATTMWS